MLGEKFGLLTVVSKEISKKGARWKCLCECGNETVVYGYKLKSGHTKSCGCLKRQPKSEETRAKIGEANRRSTMFNCDFCGSLSFEKPSHYEKTNKHFCSMICYTRYRAEVLHFTEQNSYKGVRKPGESKQVYHRRYAKRNPERIARLKARRYAREKNAEGSHTLEEWNELKARFKNRCAHCRKERELTKDHIVPLSRGGSNYISNIQPLCRSCNSKKWVYENPSLLEVTNE